MPTTRRTRCGTLVDKYHIMRTIGVGSFAKVKLAVDTETGEKVAIKVIDKKHVVDSKLEDQVEREISTMKRLRHPNIVRIYQVIATKTTIFLVMEYVPGGTLSEKLGYKERLSEEQARRYFQQLIDAVDYCHGCCVYHRDLKPQNLLLDNEGNIKVSDFGLSVLLEDGSMLSTACGSPHYVAPEVIAHKSYEGAAADLWSCGVILFELLSGKVPFDDNNTGNIYRKIKRAQYTFPEWFTLEQRRLIGKLLTPLPIKRITLREVLEDEWFRIGYEPSSPIQSATSSSNKIRDFPESNPSSSLINAFELIALSSDLDLSGLFQMDGDGKKIKLASSHSMTMTMEKIEATAKNISLSVERTKSSVRLHGIKDLRRTRSHIMLSAEVTPVTPRHCVVELSKSTGELGTYKEFCRSLSDVLKECDTSSSQELQFSGSDCGNGDEDDNESIKG